jgi:hypothetical protein
LAGAHARAASATAEKTGATATGAKHLTPLAFSTEGTEFSEFNLRRQLEF